MVSAYGCGYCMLSYKYFNEEIDNLNISLTIVDYITKDESLQKMNIEKFPNLKFIYIEENKIISKINRFPTFLVFDKNLEFIKKKIGWENSFIIYLKQLKCS
jgi:thiol-disulfide isomerase/thioredoxin